VLSGDTPVLSVEGPLAEYWRGETFSDYTGTAWHPASAGRRHLPVRAGELDVTDLFPSVSERRLQTHSVRAEVDLPFIVVAPGQIRRFKLSSGPRVELSDEGVVVDQAGCIWAPDAVLPAGSEYEVISVPVDMSGSRSVPGTDIGTGLGETYETYLGIPLGAREVADLARDVVGDTEEPLDRLAALVTYLQQNYVYSRNAPAVPMGEDAARHFLFHQKRGHCDLFATALAVMARSVGIPTRVVTGYAGGDYDTDTGRWVLRESDAHAWVEAYVAPWGWLSADATPAGDLPPIRPLHRAMLSLRFFVQDHPYWAGTLGATLVLAAVAAIVHARRRRLAPVTAGGGMGGPRGVVVQAYARLCHLLARHGAPRRASQTPLEFVAALESGELPRLSQKGRPLPPGVLAPVRALSRIFITARYGPGPVTNELAESAVQRLGEATDRLRARTP
jgi:hypothetical protein